MGRQKEFAPRDALQQAMRLFWQKGYHAVSVEDLVQVTGVARAGLYSSFGDKRSLYRLCLGEYGREILIPALRAAGEHGHLLDGLWAGLDTLKSGCFLARSLAEIPPEDTDTVAVAMDVLEQAEQTLSEAVALAQSHKEFDPRLDPRAVARLLLAARMGAGMTVRISEDDGVARSVYGMLAHLLA